VAAVGATECDVITSFTNASKCVDRRSETSLQQSFPPTTSQVFYSRRLPRQSAPTNASPVLHSCNVVGAGTGFKSVFTTMLSMPTGLGQQGVAGSDSVMRSVSMICADGAFTVSKLPSVFGTVPATVKTGLRFRNPLNSNGIGAMLE
jgi:hypothetical protein